MTLRSQMKWTMPFSYLFVILMRKMNKYVIHFVKQESIVLNATDDEEAAWLGLAHSRLENNDTLKDVQLIEE